MFEKNADRYLLHFTRFLGKPFDVERFRAEDGAGLRLATFDQRFPGFKVYASLGLSDEPTLKDLGEVILLTDDFRKDVKQMFVHFLFFMMQKEIPLGSRFSIGGIELLNADFAEHYEKTALYVMPAEGFAEGFDEVDCDGEPGKVYQALFISYNEQDFINRQGAEAFQEKLQAQAGKGKEMCALARPSVC